MISCAINSPEIIGLLYQDIIVALKNAPKDQQFDHTKYLEKLFKDFSEATSPEVAAKYLQSVPRLIIDAKNAYFPSLKAGLDALDALKDVFTAKDGITTIIKDFSPKLNTEEKKDEIKQNNEELNNTILIPINETVEITPSERFQTFSVFSGSLQNFLNFNPNKKTSGAIQVESINPDKIHIVNALSNIAIAQGLVEPTEGVQYMGEKLYFKAVNLDYFAVGKNYAALDSETQKQLTLSRSIRNKNANVSDKIAQVDQRVILVVTNEFGKILHFDNEGSIVEADKGKIVYQFMRVVRKEGDSYTVKDMYNNDNQVLSPKTIARLTYNKELDGDPYAYLKMIEDNQKKEMEKLYDLQEKALKALVVPLLPIIGISNGVSSDLSSTDILLKDLIKFPGMTTNVYSTIKNALKSTKYVKVGNSTITINDNQFGLDRSIITNDIATQIAQVLTNPKIDIEAKKFFVDQFIPEAIGKSARQHQIIYNTTKGTIFFNIYPQVGTEKEFTTQKESSINLTKSTLEKKTPENILADQTKIINMLTTKGYRKKGGGVFVSYDSKSIKSQSYLKYNATTESFEDASYLDLLTTFNGDIHIIDADPGFYNYVVNFTTPPAGKKNTPIKDAKDAIVERLKAGEEITGVINQDYNVDTWDIFNPENKLTPAIKFYNKTERVLTKADKNKSVTLKLNPLNEAGYVDVVEVYLGNVLVGNVAETDYVETSKVVTTPKSKENTKAEIVNIVAPINVPDPSNSESPVSKLFDKKSKISEQDTSDLDRKGFKKEFISPKQVEEAEEWWNSDAIAPLRNLIKFPHAVNLVNSDVFATFIVNASKIADPDGTMASIKVNKANGTYFQNLTAYHESWHVFSQLFLTKPEKIALYTELQEYTDAKGNQPYSKMKFKQLEEMLAEDFRNYVKTGKAKENAPKRNSLFRKIVEFLKQLFGKDLSKFNKEEIEIDSLNSPMASMLFNKLFIGDFNDYTPLIENAMLYELDRGIRQVDNPTEDALSPTDSNITSQAIDDKFAEQLDEQFKRRKRNAELESKTVSLKSASIVMLTSPEKRAGMYKDALESFKENLETEKEKLEQTEIDIDFNSFNTVKDIATNAAAIIQHTGGENKYVFLTSQIKNFDNLLPSLKKGERVKGEDYQDTIKITGDFYKHKTINKSGRLVDIVIVSSIEDAETQLKNYIDGKSLKYKGPLRINPKIQNVILSDSQELVRDNIRLLELIIKNWGNEKSGVVKYHMENSDYELARAKTDIVVEELKDENGEPIAEEDILTSGELNNDALVGKLSLQQMMSKETLFLIKTLFKVNKDGTTPTNRFGDKERADFTKIFTILAKTIGGVRDRNLAYKKLKEAAEQFPELKQLYETKFPDPQGITNRFEYSISRQFFHDFGNKPKATYMQLVAFLDAELGGYNFQVKESSLSIDNTINRWSAKIKSSPATEYVEKLDTNISSLKLSAIVKDFQFKGELNIDKSLEFARVIGIDMDYNDNIKNALALEPDFYGLQYIFDILKGFEEIEAVFKKDPKSSELTKTKLQYLKLFKENPIEVLKEIIPVGVLDETKFIGNIKELTQLKRLAELQTKFGFDSATTAVIRANGNTAYQDMNWSSIASYVHALNSVTNIKQLWEDPDYNYMAFLDPRINSHTLRSSIINSLFNLVSTDPSIYGNKIPGKSVLFQVVDGTTVVTKRQVKKEDGRTVEESESEGNTTTELDPLSKALQEFHTMILGGVAELPRTSEKKMSYGIKVVGGIKGKTVGKMLAGKDPNLYVDMSFFNDGKKGEMYAIGNNFFSYIQGEFDRIKKFRGPQREKYLTIKGYNRVVDIVNGKKVYAGEVFSAFDSMLLPNVKKELYKLAEKQIDVDLIDYLKDNPLRNEIVANIQSYFEEKTKEFNKLYLSKMNFISKSVYEKVGFRADTITDAKLKELRANSDLTNNILKGYLYNDFIHKYETSMLLFGDFAQWDHDKEAWSKRIPGSTSDGTGFLADKSTSSFVNNVLNKATKTSFPTYASILEKQTGIKYDNYIHSETINTGVIQDAIRDSIYLPDMIESWEEEYAEAGYSKAQIESFIKDDKKAYNGMKEGDGMAYMTFDAYRTLLTTGGKGFSLAQEALYQKIINGEKLDPNMVKEFFPVYKLHYFGFIKNDLLPATAMHKFAVIPLIPGVNAIEGSDADKLHKMMLKQNIQYVTFESGSKNVALTKDGTLDNIFADKTARSINSKVDKNGKDEFQFTPNPIFLANLKEVTIINQKFKGELPIATQTRGIILDNLFKNGKLKNKKNEEIVNKYSKTVRDYTNILKESLLNEIGFELVDGRYIGDLTQFVEIIRNELSNRDVPKHLIKLINTIKDKGLAMDLSIHPEADSIEKLLMSFIQRGLIKQKTNGESLTQTPSTFTNGIWDNEYNLLRDPKEIKKWLGTNTLPFYIKNKGGRSTEMKVAIALQGDYIDLLNGKDLEGNIIGNIDRLNELIKDPVWFEKNRDALTMFGPRIPNDATSTIEAATVWHFLDPAFGNSIILPTEIVAKAGSDYDGDKLFMNMSNINKDGTVVNEGIKDFAKVLKATVALEKAGKLPKDQLSSAKLIKEQKRFLQNEYKNAAVEILMLPENYAYLTKPNGTYLVEQYVKDLEEGAIGYNKYNNPLGQESNVSAPDDLGNRKTVMSPTRTLDQVHNLYVHDANLSLEPSLGIMAKLTKGHVIYKMENALMPSTYKASSFNKRLGKSIEGGIDLPVVMRFKKNTTKNKAGETVISLSDERTQKGTRISDVLSHGLQGILDRSTNPFPFVLQLVPEAMDIFSYLIQAGVNEEEIFYLLNQPLVKEYFADQKLRNSAFYNITHNNTGMGSPKSKSAKSIVERLLNKDHITPEQLVSIENKVNKLKLEETLAQEEDSELEKIYGVTIKKNPVAKTEAYTAELTLKQIKKLDPLSIAAIAETINDLANGKTIYNYSPNLSSAQNYVFTTKVLSDDYLGDTITMDMLKSGFKNKDADSIQALAIFMNVLELEKQFVGMKSLSQLFSPDTAKLTTSQQVIKRQEMYANLKKVSSIDQDFLGRLLKDSILASFNQDDLILDLIVPLFTLRLDSKITGFIGDVLTDPTRSAMINDKFGVGVEGQERFTNLFNNAVINYIFQNNMSNFVNKKGETVNYPEVYKKLPITVNDQSPYAAIATKKGIVINTKQIESEYANKKYINISKADDSYAKLGLDTFTLKQDPFQTLSSYYRYVIARETLRLNTTDEVLDGNKSFEKKIVELNNEDAAFESYISERALAASFNYKYIMGKTKYSYSQAVLEIINEFDTKTFNLKDTYPILAQLSLAPNTEGAKVLQLNNKKEAQGILASSYYLDIKKLGDRTVKKVKNTSDNNRISEIFNLFSLMMFYQHGVGVSKLGFVKALDPKQYKNIMTKGGKIFMAEDMITSNPLNDIFEIILNKTRFKNYTNEAEGYIHSDLALEAKDFILEEGEYEEFDLPGGNVVPKVHLKNGGRVIFEEDVAAFKTYVMKSSGRKPNEFFTSNSSFAKFYNSETGKRKGMPQSFRWILNEGTGLYYMIDKSLDADGEIYYDDVDLMTGMQMIPVGQSDEQKIKSDDLVNTQYPGKPEFNKLPGKSATPTMTYAGIGSRETPQEVLDTMTKVANYLETLGYTLNTGKTFSANKEYNEEQYNERLKTGAALSALYGNEVGLDEEGADRAFSAGTNNKNLFGVKGTIGEREMAVMEEIHPAPERLKPGAKKLMARNTNQIFGENLDTPVDFVLFYAKETADPLRPKGGTGQAVEMARRKGIPTINMADTNWRDQLKTAIATQPTTGTKTEVVIPGVEIYKINYTKETPNDKSKGFFFTENLQAYLATRNRIKEVTELPRQNKNIKLDVTAVNNQAGIRFDRNNGRPNENAFAIISKKYQQNDNSDSFVAEEGQFKDTDSDFELFKKYNTEAINEAVAYNKPLVIAEAGIATGKSALPLRFAEWLNNKLEAKLGIQGTIKENTSTGYKGYGIFNLEKIEINQPSTSVKSVDSEKSSTIATDIEVFNKLVSDNNGELPASFMVDGVRLWKIYKNGNYNLVDKDTKEIYMRNVNMETGKAEIEAELTELITDEERETAMDQLLNLLELPGIVEKFAVLGHDTNDILNNLAKAKTREEYNKVMKIIDKLCQ